MARLDWHKLALRFFAVFLALLLWVYASGEQKVANTANSQIMSIPLQQREVSDNLVLSGFLPSNVSIRVDAPRAKIESLTANDFEAYIDLSNLGEGSYNMPVVVDSPEGVEVSQVTPNKVYVVLEGIQEKQVPVTAILKGKPAKGYVASEPIVQPEMVMIRGPKSIINTIDQLNVEANIESATGKVEQTAEVRTNQINIKVTPQLVKVIVPIESIPSKELEVNPRVEGAPAVGYEITEITVKPATVKLFAASSLLQSINKVDTEIIDVSGANRDFTLQVNLVTPRGAESISSSVAEVTVRIKQSAAQEPERPVPDN